MSRYHSYLNSATTILTGYTGNEPFAAFLKNYFAANKKFGSRDRKIIAHLCYCYFRTGGLFSGDTKEEKILKGLFLCSTGPGEILEQLKSEWNERSSLPLAEKYSFLSQQEPGEKIFPWAKELSEGINAEEFASSFLIQPDLYLRIRPGRTAQVLQKLMDNAIEFSQVSPTCLALPNTTKLEGILELNKEVVVQDLSSQRIGEFLQNEQLQTTLRHFDNPIVTGTRARGVNKKFSIWDCCAASGGKSILAVDTLGKIELTVSDVRESILVNLRKRFKEAGITNYRSFTRDLATPNQLTVQAGFELIIADVPCTGSGTWSRTPEQLYFFDEKKIDQYADLQKKIIANVIGSLQPGGFLLYITCSVFRKENEEMIAFMEKAFHLQRWKMECLIGYDKKADTMFAALLQKA